jgi:surface antigen
MKQFDPTQLALFTGTEHYYRLTRKHLLTDGTKYLADAAGAYWLMDAIASHLQEIGTSDWFVFVRMNVAGTSATMIYEDGNGYEHARQEISYTDFPMPSISLYACFDGDHWVIMLKSEY